MNFKSHTEYEQPIANKQSSAAYNIYEGNEQTTLM